MYTEQQVDIRRAILNKLAMGKPIIIKTQGTPPDVVITFASKFAKAKGRALIGEAVDGDRVQLTEVHPSELKRPPGRPRIPADQRKYPISDLQVGDSVLIKLTQSEHHKVRLSASAWARSNNQKLSCNVDGDGIRVTRTE